MHFAPLAARMAMERSSAPGVFRLACSRTGLTPAASGTCVLPSVLAFGGQLHFRRPGSGRGDHQVDGKLFAGERDRRKADRFQAQRRLRPSASAKVSMGMPNCCACHARARDAALVFLAVGDQRDAGHHARGQRGDGFADGGFEIGGAAGFAGGRLQLPGLLLLGALRASRVERANGITRIQWRPCVLVDLMRRAARRDRDRAGETLAEVSTSTATRDFGFARCRDAARPARAESAQRRQRFQAPARQLARRAPPFEAPSRPAAARR